MKSGTPKHVFNLKSRRLPKPFFPQLQRKMVYPLALSRHREEESETWYRCAREATHDPWPGAFAAVLVNNSRATLRKPVAHAQLLHRYTQVYGHLDVNCLACVWLRAVEWGHYTWLVMLYEFNSLASAWHCDPRPGTQSTWVRIPVQPPAWQLCASVSSPIR